MTGVCTPDCPYYGMPDAPRHREWRRPVPVADRRDGPVMRFFMRVWGDGNPGR